MKRLTLFGLAIIFTVSTTKSQTLEEIIRQYSAAMKMDQLANIKTIKMTGRQSVMGMEMMIVLYMKSPNKIRVSQSMGGLPFGGQEILQVYDGEKAYMVNPMLGTQPVPLTDEQLRQLQNSNFFNNQLLVYNNNKQITLEGSEDVNGSAAHKLKIIPDFEGINSFFMFIDKATGLVTKQSIVAEQMGVSITMESIMSDYTEVNGFVFPKKTITFAMGMETVMTFDQVEVNIPIDDDIFTVR